MFCVNSLMLLSVGSIYLNLYKVVSSGSESIIILAPVFLFIILLVLIQILAAALACPPIRKVIKDKIFKIYLNLKKNYRYILLDKFLLWISLRSTRNLLIGLVTLFSPLFENVNFFDFNVILTLLSINLFTVIFHPFSGKSMDCFFASGWLEDESGKLPDNKLVVWFSKAASFTEVVKWLDENTNIKANQISTFDLCAENLATLSQFFNINKTEDLYAFKFGRQVYVVPEFGIKNCVPIHSERKVHLFRKVDLFEDVDKLRNYLHNINDKTAGIYDPLSKSCYVYTRVWVGVKSNNIVYYSNKGE